jgi:hypothetical protein
MSISGERVLTNSGTDFKKMSCRELKPGMEVKVKGPRQDDGAIVAQKIEEK